MLLSCLHVSADFPHARLDSGLTREAGAWYKKGVARHDERRSGGGEIRVGISACLLGNPVRYDGGHKLDRWLRDGLGAFVSWVPICPEVEYGLSVPREALLLAGEPAGPRLVSAGGVDHTAGMRAWAARRLEQLAGEDLRGFVFKSRSPSCGLGRREGDGESGGRPEAGAGIFARAFRERFPLLPLADEVRLGDPGIRKSFVERLFRSVDGNSRPAGAPGDGAALPAPLRELLLRAHD